MGKSAAAKAGEKRRRQRVKLETRLGLPQGSLSGGVQKPQNHHSSQVTAKLQSSFGNPPHHGAVKTAIRAIRRSLEHGDVDGAVSAFSTCDQVPEDVCTELMSGCLKAGRPSDACRAIEMLYCTSGAISAKQLTAALSQTAHRTEGAELLRFVDMALPLVKAAGHPSQLAYYSHFLRLCVMEFAEEAAQALEKARVVGVHALESSGNAASGLQTSATSKGGQLMLHGGRYSQYALPRDSNIIKGDTVLLQRPPAESHSGPLHSDPRWGANGGGPPANEESEAEVLSVFPQFTVKVMGAASLESVQRLCGIRVNVFRLTNKVTFTRKLDALRAVLEDGGSGGKGQASMDAALRGIVCAGFGCATTDERDAQTAAVPQMCSSPPSGTAPFAVGSAAGEVHRKENLNASQRNALLAGISQRLTLVQGPPGTGKTHTAISLISLWLRSGQGPVLATSDSNIAVDNLVGGLAAAGMAVVRVGRPESVRSDLLPHMLESQAARQADRSDREAFHHAQVAALRRAQVVCATCSGAGSEMLGKLTFPSVLLDEASQATEPSTLVPLVRGARQVALVGDHCQLPPTIISRDAELGGLNVSLFDHLVAAGVHPHLLDTQYRMHPALAAFPSKAFYSGMLRSGVEPAARKAPRGFHWPVEGAPLAFVPCSHGWERKDGSSYENHAEAEEVARIVQNFLAAGELTEGDIGIVTPYAGQVRVLRRILRVPRGADQPGVPRLEVSSVDGFQGREKELIVFSAVRSNLSGAVGFLADARRVNVMLTRARRGLVVVGSEATLSQEPTVWGPWLAWASACGLVAGRAATDPAAAAAVHAGDWAGATANVPAVWMRHGSVPTRDAEHVQAAPSRSIVGSHSSSNLVMSSYSAL